MLFKVRKHKTQIKDISRVNKKRESQTHIKYSATVKLVAILRLAKNEEQV
jgi:hypothetical protein